MTGTNEKLRLDFLLRTSLLALIFLRFSPFELHELVMNMFGLYLLHYSKDGGHTHLLVSRVNSVFTGCNSIKEREHFL